MIDILIDKIKKTNNPSVAGLDPKLDFIPKSIKDKAVMEFGESFEAAGHAIFEFNKGLIDSFYDIVPAVKPQSAYYEMYGIYGIMALDKTMKYAQQKGMYVILDVKRNDIGTTAQAYSNAYLGKTDVFSQKLSAFSADGLTMNGYLGTDGIAPFVEDCNTYGKTIFALVKTSNPSSGELQNVSLADGRPVYEKMAEIVRENALKSMGANGYSNVGAVVGATYPQECEMLRSLLKESYFLVPGYGAQGGGAKDVIPAFNKDGLGAIVNSSRGIMCAYKTQGLSDENFAQAARTECIRMRDEILSVIGS